MKDQKIRLQFGEIMQLSRAIGNLHERKIEDLEDENTKLRAGIAEAYNLIDVLYMDALDNHKESWPRAQEWMEQWKEVEE